MPSVNFKGLSFRIENFRICNASISCAEIRPLRGAIVCFPDEKTRSQGTLEAWMGIISTARWKIRGYWCWCSCITVSGEITYLWESTQPAKNQECLFHSLDYWDIDPPPFPGKLPVFLWFVFVLTPGYLMLLAELTLMVQVNPQQQMTLLQNKNHESFNKKY